MELNKIKESFCIKNNFMDQKLTLGYWPIRGFGQIPRLLLAYTGLEHQEKRYE